MLADRGVSWWFVSYFHAWLPEGNPFYFTDWCSNSKKSKQRFRLHSRSSCVAWKNGSRHRARTCQHQLITWVSSVPVEGRSLALCRRVSKHVQFETSQAESSMCGRNGVKDCQGLKTQFSPRFIHPPGQHDMPPLNLFEHVYFLAAILAFRWI